MVRTRGQYRWQRRTALRAARRQSARFIRRFKWRKNVRSVGFGNKFVSGRLTSRIAVLVYVKNKENVGRIDKIPRKIKVVTWLKRPIYLETDVIEIPTNPKLSAVNSGDEIIASTLRGTCAVAWSDNNGSYVITNDHVVRDLRTGLDKPDIIAEVGGTRYLGRVIRSTRISAQSTNRNDSAVVAFSRQMPTLQWAVDGGRLVEIGKIGPNIIYRYLAGGVTNLFCTAIARVDDEETFEVKGALGPVRYKGFWILQMTSGATKEGHSGALLHRSPVGGAILGVGIVFARLEENNWVYALDARQEWSALGLG